MKEILHRPLLNYILVNDKFLSINHDFFPQCIRHFVIPFIPLNCFAITDIFKFATKNSMTLVREKGECFTYLVCIIEMH